MDAILLAGGYGTRLRPLTYTRPKPLLVVAGRPMVEWVLDRLPSEVHRVIVAVNWKAQQLGGYFATRERQRGQNFDVVVVREEEPLGTGGAVKNCEQHLTSDRFLVLNADIVSTMDLAALSAAHKANKATATISLKEVPAPDVVNFGVVKPGAAGQLGALKVESFVEKPARPELAPSRLINAGAYLLERRVAGLIPAGRMVSLEKETFPLVMDNFWGLPFAGSWIDVGDPQRLRQASHALDAKRALGKGTVVADGASVSDTVAGGNCHIGVGAAVVGCVLGDNVTVASGVHLEDCVVGDGERVTQSQKGARIWTRPVPSGYPEKQVGNALAR